MKIIRAVRFGKTRAEVFILDWETGRHVARREYNNVSKESYERLHRLWKENLECREPASMFIPGGFDFSRVK